MKEQGQIYLEAVICFIVFLAILAGLLSAMKTAEGNANNAADSIHAEVSAQKCAIIVDALYVNGGWQIKNLEISCFLKAENLLGSIYNGETKEAFAFPKEISFVQSGEKSVLEVEVNEHYK